MIEDRETKSVALIGTRGYPSFYGGFETAVRRLAPFLVDAGWRVTAYGRRRSLASNFAGADTRVESVCTPGLESKSFSTLTFGFTSALHAAARRPDVALVMNVANGFWLPLLKLRGIRTVVNVDGLEWERAKWSRLGRLVFKMGARATARFADELVFDAEAIGDYWREVFGRGGTFIPYGGDAVAELSLKDDLVPGSYVLVVARLVPENSIREFLDAAETLSRELPVVVVGTSGSGGEIEERLSEMVGRLKNLHWLGHVSDDDRLFALWQHAGVYFHGHSVGGTNPALVQAMALGATIVARDTVYNREVLGDAGLVCEPRAQSIVATVKKAIDDPGDLGPRARERAGKHYSWDGVCQSYSDLLDKTRRTR